MLKYILLVTSIVFILSCGGGENSTPVPTTETAVVNSPREVGINLPKQIITNEKTTLRIEVSFTGSILPTDKIIVATNSHLIVAKLNDDRNSINVDISDVTIDTDAIVKVNVEGPLNSPSKEATLSIINISANAFIQELKKIILEGNENYNYVEELHIANMLSLTSAIRSNNFEEFSIIFKTFQENLQLNQGKVNAKFENYKNAIKKYEEKSIDETTLRSVYQDNKISKADYNFEKISLLNKVLKELTIPIEFPQNLDSTESNFFYNRKMGGYINGQFFFNTNYYYLNSILDKNCIGS